MNSDLHDQIFNSMDLRETDELLDIWQDNDRVEWSQEAFAVIEEILKGRGVEIPEQDEPVYEHVKEDLRQEKPDDHEPVIVEDENPPEFYDPKDVLKVGAWLEFAARVMIVLAVATSLSHFSNYKNYTLSYFPRQTSFWVYVVPYLLAFLIDAAEVIISVAVTYFPLIALARILKVLMQMEYNSRHPASKAES